MSLLFSEDQKQFLQKAPIEEPNLEMIGIINKRGKMIESKGFESLGMLKSKKEMFLMKIALRASMQSDFDKELGKVNYCLTQRGNRKFISIPYFGNNTILMVTKKNCSHEELMANITQTLKNQDQFDESIINSGEP